MTETNIQPIPSQKMITPLYSAKRNDAHQKIPQDMDAANATTDHIDTSIDEGVGDSVEEG